MKKTLLFLGIFFAITSHSIAQVAVALHTTTGVQMFYSTNPFVDAYNASSTGDTIYLPGGFFNVPPNINKGLVIYGAGHYPDSTSATNKTVLTATLTLQGSADGLRLEGLQITGSINFTSNTSVNYVTIKRNHITGNIDFAGSGTPSTNALITQNVIDGDLGGTNAQQPMLITNNIIGGKFFYVTGAVIQNNIFLASYYSSSPWFSYHTMYSMANNTIANNIFLNISEAYILSGTGNYVYKNVFLITYNQGSNTASGNYNNVSASAIFTSQSGNTFNYTHNYHLQSPATYLGTDTTQCGIYGGYYPYKEGAVPSNPHIRQKTISTLTDVSGNINVNIKVAAQDK